MWKSTNLSFFITRFSLRGSLLVTRYSLLVNCYFLLATNKVPKYHNFLFVLRAPRATRLLRAQRA